MTTKPHLAVDNTGKASGSGARRASRPTTPQLIWLRRGIEQPGGKLPLFDANGKRVSERTVRACLEQGWAETWFDNPIKPDWMICKLTTSGREIAAR